MTPTDAQAAAIRAIVAWYGDDAGPQEFYLAGYAGVGKSTVANEAIEALKERYKITRVRTGAFTGKAASALRKKGVEGAQTIHSMIYTVKEDKETGRPTFMLNQTGPAADADIIVLDECSMVGDEMADDLRSFGKKILVMGDPGQLPPVRGTGAFTNRKPDIFLTEIHRQAAESPILRLATMARRGERIPVGDYGGGVHVKMLDAETQHDVYDPDTQPICGVHRTRWTVTQRFRRRLFGHKDLLGETPLPPLPVKGERIMCCKNSTALGIFNGQLGTATENVEELEPGGLLTMNARLEDHPVMLKELAVHPYLFNQHFSGPSDRPKMRRDVHEFDWSYVLTCHKAQGSEWPHVTVIDDSAAFRDERDRWLYTALTRPSEGLTLLKRAA